MYARMTSKGQVTIPQEIRKKLKLKEGSLIAFVLKGQQAEITQVEDDVMALKGSVQAQGRQNFAWIETEVEKRIAQDVVGEA